MHRPSDPEKGGESARDPVAHDLAGDLALALRRGRQRHGISQRVLARRSGVATGTIARLETGRPGSLADAVAALGAVGLGLRVVDGAGCPWQRDDALGMDLDEIRDVGGRRLPAHLRICDPPLPEPWWHYCRRRDRPEHAFGDLPGPDGRATYMHPERAAFEDSLDAWDGGRHGPAR
jgi:transcriptional regulator with XRE-family HTH domain